MKKGQLLLLLGGAAVVLLLGGLLYGLGHGSTGGSATPAPAPRPSPADGPAPSTRAMPNVNHGPAPVPPPVAASPVSPDVAPPASPPTIVRDHTSEPPSGARSAIDPGSVAAMRVAMEPKVKECAAPLRSRMPPVKGRLYAVVTAEASGGSVTVTKVELKPMHFDDADVLACVEAAFRNLSVAGAEGQVDGTDRLYLPFDVP